MGEHQYPMLLQARANTRYIAFSIAMAEMTCIFLNIWQYKVLGPPPYSSPNSGHNMRYLVVLSTVHLRANIRYLVVLSIAHIRANTRYLILFPTPSPKGEQNVPPSILFHLAASIKYLTPLFILHIQVNIRYLALLCTVHLRATWLSSLLFTQGRIQDTWPSSLLFT